MIGLEPASVRISVRVSTLSYTNISETSGPITIKFCLKQCWGRGKATAHAQIRFVFDWIVFILAGSEDNH